MCNDFSTITVKILSAFTVRSLESFAVEQSAQTFSMVCSAFIISDGGGVIHRMNFFANTPRRLYQVATINTIPIKERPRIV